MSGAPPGAQAEAGGKGFGALRASDTGAEPGEWREAPAPRRLPGERPAGGAHPVRWALTFLLLMSVRPGLTLLRQVSTARLRARARDAAASDVTAVRPITARLPQATCPYQGWFVSKAGRSSPPASPGRSAGSRATCLPSGEGALWCVRAPRLGAMFEKGASSEASVAAMFAKGAAFNA